MAASNQIQANEKLVNYYYLLQQNNPGYQYTAGDSSAIYSIASQCQNEGGSIVWQARMMYFDIIGERVSFDDYCLEMGKSLVHHGNSISTASSNNVKLYPNPNNGNFILEKSIGEHQNGVLTIFDITGKIISSHSFNGAVSHETIDATQLDAGVYFYEIKIDGGKIKTDKLVIIK